MNCDSSLVEQESSQCWQNTHSSLFILTLVFCLMQCGDYQIFITSKMCSWPKKKQKRCNLALQYSGTKLKGVLNHNLKNMLFWAIEPKPLSTFDFWVVLNGFINANILLQIRLFLGKLNIKYFFDILNIEV